MCAKNSQFNVLLFFCIDIEKGFNNLSLFVKLIDPLNDIMSDQLNLNPNSCPSRYYKQMSVRAIRGATQLDLDSIAEMDLCVGQLLTQMLDANNLSKNDLISIILTSTQDLKSDFPAAAARKIGLGSVPLLCSVEIDVAGALPRVVRVMMHANLEVGLTEVKHIYLKGAAVLRKDLAQ